MITVCCNSLQPVQQGLLQGTYIFINIKAGDKVQRCTLFGHSLNSISRGKGGCRMGKVGFAACCSNFFFQSFTQFNGLVHHNHKTLRIKINIGQGGKDGFHGESVHGFINYALLAGLVGKQGHTA